VLLQKTKTSENNLEIGRVTLYFTQEVPQKNEISIREKKTRYKMEPKITFHTRVFFFGRNFICTLPTPCAKNMI
jgi:hypothetical protein